MTIMKVRIDCLPDLANVQAFDFLVLIDAPNAMNLVSSVRTENRTQCNVTKKSA